MRNRGFAIRCDQISVIELPRNGSGYTGCSLHCQKLTRFGDPRTASVTVASSGDGAVGMGVAEMGDGGWVAVG
jgi:hypothetical protein